MTLSTSESEDVAMATGAKNALAMMAVLSFVEPHLSDSTIGTYEDNEGSKALAETPKVFTAANTLMYASIYCGAL